MKQSAAKTLGVAALGAAFAAAGAGAANAAPAVPDATSALGTVTQHAAGGERHQGAAGRRRGAAQGQPALGSGLSAVQPAVEKVLADGPTAPVAGLLGRPAAVEQGLPTHGLPVNGFRWAESHLSTILERADGAHPGLGCAPSAYVRAERVTRPSVRALSSDGNRIHSAM
jgi:hypothetical protein